MINTHDKECECFICLDRFAESFLGLKQHDINDENYNERYESD
jgi:hypothetical protein